MQVPCYAVAIFLSIPVVASAISTRVDEPLSSASRLRKLRYVCHPTAMNPAKSDRYSSGINAKLKAVTAGHNLHELTKLTGTVCLTRSQMASTFSPAKAACIPKKYVLKMGVKHIWLMTTLVASERRRDG